jgi:hypothetical protein
MKQYEIKIAKVVYRTTDEFQSELEARIWAASQRDKYSELLSDNAVEYYFEVEEVPNV